MDDILEFGYECGGGIDGWSMVVGGGVLVAVMGGCGGGWW